MRDLRYGPVTPLRRISMKTAERILPGPVSSAPSTGSDLQTAGIILCAASLCVAALFWATIQSMVDVWGSSRTFTHGFLVLPVVGYLVWSSRHRVASLGPDPDVRGVMALLGMGVAWMVGHFAKLLWLEQAAVVAFLPGLVWTIFGTEIVRRLAWPLGFLMFLLPVGTSLEPWLQDITAWLILRGLDLSGITYVYRDYNIVVGPAVWTVAPDCGGLRYLLPGLSLAYAFVALTYRQPTRRLLFLIFCAIAIMIANGLRAYGVIVGNHLGIAVDADHRVFSYTIYGLTMPFLFWVGLKWKQRPEMEVAAQPFIGGGLDIRKAIVLSGSGVILLFLTRLIVWL